ncbi:hypothetical protein PybrP1_003632 [[Pythium] brassicae (nom. inval.)]|nr:hypothetical protein PybrP1_003632 [[Pythium] brassicae (nom. inval.)]
MPSKVFVTPPVPLLPSRRNSLFVFLTGWTALKRTRGFEHIREAGTGSSTSEHEKAACMFRRRRMITFQFALHRITTQKRETKEEAFKAVVQQRERARRGKGQRGTRNSGSTNARVGEERRTGARAKRSNSRLTGQCFECKLFRHKKADCPRRRAASNEEFVFLTTFSANVREAKRLLDSGASSHMTSDQAGFVEFQPLSNTIDITLANDHRLAAVSVGAVSLRTDEGVSVTLTEVLFVPKLDRKLISISALTARGVVVEFLGDRASLILNEKVVATVLRVGKLFSWNVLRKSGEKEAHQWTARTTIIVMLGSVSQGKMELVAKACDGVPAEFAPTECVCAGCALAKMTRAPFAYQSGTIVKTASPFEIVHGDVMGPMNSVSKGGARFVLTFIDDFSRCVFVYLIVLKALVFDRFLEFKRMVETQFGIKVKRIRTDNGTEIVNKRFNALCASSGIIRQTSAPYSPPKNGLAECRNRTLVKSARSMMHYMHLDLA